ncbi:MAG TPA: DUF4166 domain-containing protein [Steroidobacteraceae bacterium]|nr:DUF4166 domain-containing protein [Steroidobacteraceae bacterium]
MTTASTLTRPRTHPLTNKGAATAPRHGLRDVIGTEAWNRLPEAVRERFADSTQAVSYAGAFEIVHASALGRVIAWLGTLFGTPVAPRAELNVETRVHVRPTAQGVAWDREYKWADGAHHLVRSTKVVTADGKLVEKLPARLCMPLATFEKGGVLHFVSRGYYFDLGFNLWLPRLLSPGVTHVEHIDLGHGWFRFTMTVTHPLLGEVFFQTGRFCATEEMP